MRDGPRKSNLEAFSPTDPDCGSQTTLRDSGRVSRDLINQTLGTPSLDFETKPSSYQGAPGVGSPPPV
jgi:hypothetical protein